MNTKSISKQKMKPATTSATQNKITKKKKSGNVDVNNMTRIQPTTPTGTIIFHTFSYICTNKCLFEYFRLYISTKYNYIHTY